MGIFILYLFGLFHTKRKKPSTINKVAIFKSAAIGDIVLLTAILNDIKKYTNYNVTLILGMDNHSISNVIKDCPEIIIVDIKNLLKSIREIRKNNFDCLIDFGSWPRIDAIISYFSNSQYSAGYNTKGQQRHFAYDFTINHNDKIHELENYRNLISKVLDIKCTSSPVLICDKLIINKYNQAVLIHMWPGGYKSQYKEWNKKSWLILIKKIIEHGYVILLSGTQKNIHCNTIFVNQCEKDKVINIAGQYNLNELSSIMDQSHAVVSVNTGIAHMAAALGKPTVCLNGPTSPKRWSPLGDHVKNVNSTKEGAGFLNLGFEYDCGPADTMEYISVEDVYTNLIGLIN